MEKETLTIIANAAITIISILIVYFVNLAIKRYNKKHGKNIPTMENIEIIEKIIEAEFLLGKGQGTAKLNYVLGKLGKKDKKTINKVNEIHSVIKNTEATLEKIRKEKDK